MIRPIATAALLAFAGLSSLPAAAPLTAKSYPAFDDIAWRYAPAGVNATTIDQLTFSRKGQQATHSASEAAELMGASAIVAMAQAGAPVSFTVVREAGALACTGRVEAPGRASGTCRFDPDARFTDALAERGIAPEEPSDLLAATFVDARVGQVDAIEQAGYDVAGFDDVITIAALEVTADFARSLREGGLRFTTLESLVEAKAVEVTPEWVAQMRAAGLALEDADDIVSARAVEVTPEWLAGMARVGYGELSVEQAVRLKALDVTPDYVAKMDRVLAAVGE